MLWLIEADQVIGPAAADVEYPANLQVVEGDEAEDRERVYFDGDRVRLRPPQPPGGIWGGNGWGLPPITPPSLDEAKAQRQAQAYAIALNLYNSMIANYHPGEMAGWVKKEAEAVAFLASGNDQDAPFLKLEAIARSITLEALAQKVVDNAALFRSIDAHWAGVRGKHYDAIAELETVEEVLVYDLNSGWELPVEG